MGQRGHRRELDGPEPPTPSIDHRDTDTHQTNGEKETTMDRSRDRFVPIDIQGRDRTLGARLASVTRTRRLTALLAYTRVGYALPKAQSGTIRRDRLGRTPMAEGEQRTLFTTSEAAHLLGITPGAVKDAIVRGTLDYIPINPRLNMVTVEAIETYRRERLGKRGGYRGRKSKAAEDAASSDTTTQGT